MSGFAFWRSQDYAEDERYDEEEEQRYEPVSRQEEIAYRTPKDSGDARTIADDVKSGTTVIFHVDALDAELTLRVLDYLSGRHVNISTIEDPVEKNLPDINQTQVNPVAGLTFDVGLRALMRQDPDIIMVGETRDGETAGTSVRAAITGHMVLSTLHTNDAVSSIVRLEDMGVETYLVANSLVGLVAQRLVRKVCPHCARQMKTTEQERLFLGEDVRVVTRGTGCTKCNNTGYKGRIAVHEILAINNDIRRMIINHTTIEEINRYAREVQHMRTLKESGLILVKEGKTTPEELLKISYE